MNRSLSAAAVLIVSAVALRADYGYQIRAEISGGTLLEVQERPFITHLIKGKRLAIVSKGHTTVINLENQLVTEIDYVKKTFRNLTFAQFNESLPHAPAPVTFQTSTKPGGIRTIGILTAHEQTVRMSSATPDLAHLFLDYWTMTPPGFEEVQSFRQNLAAKFGDAFAVGLAEIAAMKPELVPGLDEAAKILDQSEELPVATLLRIGGPDSADLAPTNENLEKTGILGEMLNQLGNIGRRVTRRAAATQQDEPAGLLTEITIEMTNFASGPADESKFNVPFGFKEIKPAEPKKTP